MYVIHYVIHYLITESLAKKILLVASLIGLLLFLCLALAVKPTIADDSPTYTACAEALSQFAPNECDPSRTPGYPIFLLLSDTLFGGLGFQMSVVIQYLMVLASAFLLYQISLLVFSDARIGLLAFVLTTTYPLFLFYSNNVLTEIPFMFLLTAGAYATVRYGNSKQLSWLAGSALLFGFAALTRPYAIFFLPLLLGYAAGITWKRWKILTRDVIVAAVLFAAVLLPWVWKNNQQFGKPALHYLSGIALATNVYRVDGLHLIDSKPYAAEKTQIQKQDPQMLNPYKVLESMGHDPAEIDAILTAVSWESIQRQPLAYAQGTLVNFAKLTFYPKYAYGDYLVIDQRESLRGGQLSEAFFYIYRDLQYKFNYPVIWLTLLGIFGAALRFRKSPAAIAFIAALTLLSLAIPAAAIIPNVRYRAVTDQFFTLFASAATIWLWDKIKPALKHRPAAGR